MIQYAHKPLLLRQFSRKSGFVLLTVFWLLGISFGLFFISASNAQFSNLIITVSHQKQSLLGLLSVLFVPVLITAVAVYFTIPILIYIYAVIKAVCFSCTLCAIAIVFGNASWLLLLLLLFTDSFVVIFLLFLWYCLFTCKSISAGKLLLIYFGTFSIIGMIDYFLVSPYLVMLMHNL